MGTHAFVVLGNLLGARGEHAALRTQDIDEASTAKMTITVTDTKADFPKLLDGLHMGFIPVPPFNPKHPSTSFRVRGNPLRLDVLTPEKHPRKNNPVFIPRFNVSAQPIRFLDYLIDDPAKGAVIDGGGIFVNRATRVRSPHLTLTLPTANSVIIGGDDGTWSEGCESRLAT